MLVLCPGEQDVLWPTAPVSTPEPAREPNGSRIPCAQSWAALLPFATTIQDHLPAVPAAATPTSNSSSNSIRISMEPIPAGRWASTKMSLSIFYCRTSLAEMDTIRTPSTRFLPITTFTAWKQDGATGSTLLIATWTALWKVDTTRDTSTANAFLRVTANSIPSNTSFAPLPGWAPPPPVRRGRARGKLHSKTSPRPTNPSRPRLPPELPLELPLEIPPDPPPGLRPQPPPQMSPRTCLAAAPTGARTTPTFGSGIPERKPARNGSPGETRRKSKRSARRRGRSARSTSTAPQHAGARPISAVAPEQCRNTAAGNERTGSGTSSSSRWFVSAVRSNPNNPNKW
mmetsp:Transcript_5147/g.11412  ORF Transcript_5147/g.11412 Transcript_5147/m.11412 type:complete len:343 (-) Transcript_5147:99-1127(-)